METTVCWRTLEPNQKTNIIATFPCHDFLSGALPLFSRRQQFQAQKLPPKQWVCCCGCKWVAYKPKHKHAGGSGRVTDTVNKQNGGGVSLKPAHNSRKVVLANRWRQLRTKTFHVQSQIWQMQVFKWLLQNKQLNHSRISRISFNKCTSEGFMKWLSCR